MKEQISKQTIANHKQALRIFNTAQKEDWPFSRTFAELKLLHLNRYEVKPASGETTFFWHDGAQTTLQPDKPASRNTGDKFDEQAIKDAIVKTKKKLIDYEKFLDLISLGGCALYEVNFKTDEIVYYGVNENNRVVEKIQTK